MAKKPGRNDPCSCGSGLKSKRCCRRGGAADTDRRPALPWTMGGSADLGGLDFGEPWKPLEEYPDPMPLEITVRPVSWEDLQHPPPLAGDESLVGAQLRVFEVVEVVDGLGYRVVEIDGTSSEPIWVDDREGSWIATPGTLFAGRFGDESSVRLPEHPDCPLCEAERERRKREALRARAM